MLEYAKWLPKMKNKYLKTTTTIIIINFFGLAIIYYQVCYVIIMIHISSKPSIGVTKKYHNVNSNYNNSQLEFGKKKTIIWMIIIKLVLKEVLWWMNPIYQCYDIV